MKKNNTVLKVFSVCLQKNLIIEKKNTTHNKMNITKTTIILNGNRNHVKLFVLESFDYDISRTAI